ncbi:hypothetical protein EKK58_02245 [Candidatus Dependentiae bacterium]|nr:MAG: hypothetical protein EKK58_02245 [Candidatus Dependentiae bacterium]
MKKNIAFLINFIFFCLKPISGPITTQIVTPEFTQCGSAFWYSDSFPYTEGGVSFKFPNGLFTEKPRLIVSLEIQKYEYQGILITPIITWTDQNVATITVNIMRNEALKIFEAPTDSVIVNILAIGTADGNSADGSIETKHA